MSRDTRRGSLPRRQACAAQPRGGLYSGTSALQPFQAATERTSGKQTTHLRRIFLAACSAKQAGLWIDASQSQPMLTPMTALQYPKSVKPVRHAPNSCRLPRRGPHHALVEMYQLCRMPFSEVKPLRGDPRGGVGLATRIFGVLASARALSATHSIEQVGRTQVQLRAALTRPPEPSPQSRNAEEG